jgi:hypothetical protein
MRKARQDGQMGRARPPIERSRRRLPISRAGQRSLCAILAAALIGLSSPATLSARPIAGAARKDHATKCSRRGKVHSKHARSCKKKRGKKKHKHPAAKGKTTTPGTGKTTKPSSGGGSSKPTLTASAVSLTPEERALFESVNKERAEHGVASLSTSAQLQPISEARAKQTAEEYASKGATSIDDVRVAIEDAGYCVTSQREIESGGPSRAEKELEERRSRELKERGLLAGGFAPAFAEIADSEETIEERDAEEEERIPVEPQWTLLGVGIAEAGTVAVELEDFVEPC